MFHSDEAWFGFTNFARQRVWVIFALAKFVFFAAKELIRMNNNYLEKYILPAAKRMRMASSIPLNIANTAYANWKLTFIFDLR